jgi:hypothetical protein
VSVRARAHKHTHTRLTTSLVCMRRQYGMRSSTHATVHTCGTGSL